LILSNGHIYVGDFINSKFNGKGKMTYANGNVEEGYWVDGKFIGDDLDP